MQRASTAGYYSTDRSPQTPPSQTRLCSRHASRCPSTPGRALVAPGRARQAVLPATPGHAVLGYGSGSPFCGRDRPSTRLLTIRITLN